MDIVSLQHDPIKVNVHCITMCCYVTMDARQCSSAGLRLILGEVIYHGGKTVPQCTQEQKRGTGSVSILLVKVKFMAESALCMMSNASEPTDDPQIAPLFRSLSQCEILKHKCKTNLNNVMFYNVRSLIYGLFCLLYNN